MKICELFSSIEGEGIRAGYPCTFIRTVGCNLRCEYCDSTYSFQSDENTLDLSINEIVKKCTELKNKRVTFTGGEPLAQPQALELIKALIFAGFEVNVETNGAIDLSEILEYREVNNIPTYKLLLTVDYKCASSGMNSKMIYSNFKQLRSDDIVKFVVGSEEDLDEMNALYGVIKGQFFVSPVFGKIEPKEIVEYIKSNDLQEARIQLQMHKFIWPPNKRGV